MTRFDLLKQIDDMLFAADIILGLAYEFNDPDRLREHLEGTITKEELQQINEAAQKEGRQPLSFSFKQ